MLAVASPAIAGEYQTATTDGPKLTIFSKHGTLTAPLTETDQVGFAQVRVAEDGMTVGWVTSVSCCASYPYEVTLVLFRNGKVVQHFHDGGVTGDWMFVDSDTVAYRWGLPHGSEDQHYVKRRISDGKVLAEFSCGSIRKDGPEEPAPKWITSIAGDCP